MRSLLIILSLTVCGSMLTACGGKKLEVLKSPCAGAEDSPCGPKRPANEWWQQQQQADSGFQV